MSHPFGGNLMNDAPTGKHTGVNSQRIAMRTQIRRIGMRVTPLTDCNFFKSFVSFISCHSFSLPLAQYYVLPSAR